MLQRSKVRSGAVKPFFYIVSRKQLDYRPAMRAVGESPAFLHELEKLQHFLAAEILAGLYGSLAGH